MGLAEVALLHVPGLSLRRHASDQLDFREHHHRHPNLQRFRLLGAGSHLLGDRPTLPVDPHRPQGLSRTRLHRGLMVLQLLGGS